MNVRQCFLIVFCCATSVSASELPDPTLTVSYATLTELDEHLVEINSAAEMRRYMASRSLDSVQMMQLLDENIKEQLAFTGRKALRDLTASSTLYAMTLTDVEGSLPRLLEYSGQDYPEAVRAKAASLYIEHAGDAGFVLATNVMAQPWRTFREHGSIRIEFYNQAKSASLETRDKYVNFLKWAILYAEDSTSATIDDHLCELDSTWRTNEIRKINAIRLLKTRPNQIATNDLFRIIRDYEIASGLREPEPPPPNVPESPETAVAKPDKKAAPQNDAPDTATQPMGNAFNSSARAATAVGFGVVVVLAVLALLKFRRR